MNTIGKLMSTAILAGALTAMSPGPLWAQATDNAPTKNAVAERQPHAELVVENNNWLDAHLYVVRGGMKTSLGFITALGRREFELPSRTVLPGDEVQILVHLIGGVSFLTTAVDVYPGDVVELVIQNNLALGSTGLKSM
jgi:hypothetical protein